MQVHITQSGTMYTSLNALSKRFVQKNLLNIVNHPPNIQFGVSLFTSFHFFGQTIPLSQINVKKLDLNIHYLITLHIKTRNKCAFM